MLTAHKIEIKNPGKSWSPCWLNEGEDWCPGCRKAKPTFNRFDTKEELIEGYIQSFPPEDENHKKVLQVLAKSKLKYVPHLYRGGWVIVGYGYSTERIAELDKSVKGGKPNIGNPLLIA